MSKWNHVICDSCWNIRSPERAPVRIRPGVFPEEMPECCFCGTPTTSGIFVREDPKTLRCNGNHPE